MSTGRDWLMRPVLEGLASYDKLLDGSLSLDDISEMNEALDVRAENSRKK
jgi:hypothetical protein